MRWYRNWTRWWFIGKLHDEIVVFCVYALVAILSSVSVSKFDHQFVNLHGIPLDKEALPSYIQYEVSDIGDTLYIPTRIAYGHSFVAQYAYTLIDEFLAKHHIIHGHLNTSNRMVNMSL